MMDPDGGGKLPRRGFLDLLIGIGALGTAGSALFPVLRYLEPLPTKAAGGPLQLSDPESRKLQSQGYVIVSSGPHRAIVFRDDSDRVRALSAKCTHEGCTVQYSAGESIVWCACHNGRFDIDGRVLSGPPPKALQEYTVVEEDGQIVLDWKTA